MLVVEVLAVIMVALVLCGAWKAGYRKGFMHGIREIGPLKRARR